MPTRFPDWPPLEIPAPPNPADATEFQVLAEEHFPQIDAADNALGVDLALTDAARGDQETAVDLIGVDLGDAAQDLADQEAEAAGDTLIPELEAAVDQDAAIATATSDLAAALGPETPTIDMPLIEAPPPATEPIGGGPEPLPEPIMAPGIGGPSAP